MLSGWECCHSSKQQNTAKNCPVGFVEEFRIAAEQPARLSLVILQRIAKHFVAMVNLDYFRVAQTVLTSSSCWRWPLVVAPAFCGSPRLSKTGPSAKADMKRIARWKS